MPDQYVLNWIDRNSYKIPFDSVEIGMPLNAFGLLTGDINNGNFQVGQSSLHIGNNVLIQLI